MAMLEDAATLADDPDELRAAAVSLVSLFESQAPGTGKTKTARIWTYVRDESPWLGQAPPAAWYQFTVDRKGEAERRQFTGVAHRHPRPYRRPQDHSDRRSPALELRCGRSVTWLSPSRPGRLHRTVTEWTPGQSFHRRLKKAGDIIASCL